PRLPLIRPMFLRRIILFLFVSAGACFCQGPKIGTIDFYGLHKVPEARVRKALGFAEGSPLPQSKGDVEEKITEVPGIVDAHLEAACCDDAGKAILYVGVEERGAPHFNLRSAPEGNAKLPEEI